ncbi:MAG: RluA family pseudouridine synthase [Anaerolineae bacterium]|nr:RluA family pseudouridine synthase [Anaerolineae bacterium]
MFEDEITPPDFELVADDADAGVRLDKLVADQVEDLSRTRIQALIKDGSVTVNGEVLKPSYRIELGDRIAVHLPEPETSEVVPEDIPLDVLYEDDDLIAINKPAGMVVHPSYGHTSGTLVNAVLYRWPELREVGDTYRAGIVHRLDKDTSGVIVVAKTPRAHRSLAEQFEQRTTVKKYLALVEGNPESNTGRIEAPIGRDQRQRKRMAVVRGGRESVTEFKVLAYYAEQALLEVRIFSGRTHQIRVHMAFIGHPVVGDTVYGYRKQRIGLKRNFLHAAELTVHSPSTGQPLTFSTPLPAGLQNILDKLPR